MRISVINGPNLNLTGRREPEIYGTQSLESYLQLLVAAYPDVEFTFFQSNIEGEIVDEIQRTGFDCVNACVCAERHHSAIAPACKGLIADALRAVPAPAVEVHLSNVYDREPERHHSAIAPACKGLIAGFGLDSYRLAVEALDSMHNS